MHKIHEKEFTLEDFSTDHLFESSLGVLEETIGALNYFRDKYINGGLVPTTEEKDSVYEPKNKDIWWQMIQLLPSSYNQKRTVMLNYEVLANIYNSRKDHKLDEWAESHGSESCRPSYGFTSFCDWIKALPYSELITGIKDLQNGDDK